MTLSIVLILFFVLLFIGMPIGFVIIGASGVGIMAMGSNPMMMVQQLFGGMNSFTYLSIPFFIMAGDIAAEGLTSSRIIDLINAFLGRRRGGLGIATVIACVFFGAITGSAIATVVAIGAFMMPKLLESGYPKALVLGIITAAGTLGVMIPPSIPMLTYSLAMSVSAGDMFTAGFVPGLLTAGLFCVYVYVVAVRKNIPITGEVLSFKEKMQALVRSIWAIMFPVIVLGSIYGGLATPTEAAVISLFYVVLVELFIYKKVKLKDIPRLLVKSMISSATLTLTIAAAQVFVWYLTTSQVTTQIYNALTNSFTSATMLMIVMAILFLIVGCFTSVMTVCVILGPLIKPVLTFFGISLVQFGISAILMSQIGFLTPPFGYCLFVTMKVSKSSMGEVAKATMPFLILMLFSELLLILFPQLSLALGTLIG